MTEDPQEHVPPRRGFLRLLALCAGVALVPGGEAEAVPVERELREADFYQPHDLAG